VKSEVLKLYTQENIFKISTKSPSHEIVGLETNNTICSRVQIHYLSSYDTVYVKVCSTLKAEAACSSETLVTTYKTAAS
jgi:hypothetical protein